MAKILGLSSSPRGKSGTTHMVKTALEEAGILHTAVDVLMVDLPHRPGSLAKMARLLADENVTIRYATDSEGVKEEEFDLVVLGHFHVEKDLVLEPPGPAGRVMVLPEWKGSRRYLRVGADGRAAFVDS